MFQIGDIIYANLHRNIAEKCEIIGMICDTTTHLEVYHVHSLENYDNCNVPINRVYATREKALQAYGQKFTKIKE